MPKHNQNGGAGVLVLSLILMVLLIGALAFAGWAFAGRQDYKDHVAAKVAVAVKTAQQQQITIDNARFAQDEKQPLHTFNGPEAYGSLKVSFPKTWSAYINDSGLGNALVDGYFTPGILPSITDRGTVYSLRFQVLSQTYSSTLQSLSGQERAGKITVQAYSLPKVPKVVGVEVNGLLSDGNSGSMIILPLRSETIEVWTDTSQYLSDFSTFILPNFSFSP